MEGEKQDNSRRRPNWILSSLAVAAFLDFAGALAGAFLLRDILTSPAAGRYGSALRIICVVVPLGGTMLASPLARVGAEFVAVVRVHPALVRPFFGGGEGDFSSSPDAALSASSAVMILPRNSVPPGRSRACARCLARENGVSRTIARSSLRLRSSSASRSLSLLNVIKLPWTSMSASSSHGGGEGESRSERDQGSLVMVRRMS